MSSLSAAEEYLEKKAREIIEPMILSTLNERPEDPILFMIQWLSALKGESSSVFSKERDELNSLKHQMKHLSKTNVLKEKEIRIHLIQTMVMMRIKKNYGKN